MNAKAMKMDECEVPYCIIDFIDNAADMKRKFKTSDAVIFQGGRMPDNPPRRHHIDQVYIFASIESPLHLQYSMGKKTWNKAINWTMTYRTDSDIPYKYGAVQPKTVNPVPLLIRTSPRNLTQIFQQKTKDVAWLVSDCVTESFREKYVQQLRKYIKVDIYGRCGTFHNCSKEEGIECMEQLAKEYKFYLSFENSVCKDYITEKVFAWFKMDIINVVRGAITYEDILPSHTYINTEKFESIKELAQLLQHLSKNEYEYTRYLKEKSKFRIETPHAQYQKAYCDLCKRLHNLEDHQKIYPDIREWWYEDTCQRKPTDIN